MLSAINIFCDASSLSLWNIGAVRELKVLILNDEELSPLMYNSMRVCVASI